MSEQHERTDRETEASVREALNMKYAFGDDAARTFLKLRGVDPELSERVLTAPRSQLRG